MILTKASFEKIEELASTLISTLNIIEPPVPIEEIVNKMGLKLIEYSFGEDISGMLVVNDAVSVIGYNPLDNSQRVRFTIAHELGHYLLHRNKRQLFVDKDFLVKFRNANTYSESERRQEQEANVFAAAILMPKEFIKKEIHRDNLSETEFISALSKKFKVSEVAMSYRITNVSSYLWD